jgi:hypothetical protein
MFAGTVSTHVARVFQARVEAACRLRAPALQRASPKLYMKNARAEAGKDRPRGLNRALVNAEGGRSLRQARGTPVDIDHGVEHLIEILAVADE